MSWLGCNAWLNHTVITRAGDFQPNRNDPVNKALLKRTVITRACDFSAESDDWVYNALPKHTVITRACDFQPRPMTGLQCTHETRDNNTRM